METTMNFTKINVDTFSGSIPSGSDLVVTEKGSEGDDNNTYVLMGFDELWMFDSNFVNPVYGFLKTTIN